VRDNNLIKVKSCSALLHRLLVCICSYLKSVLKFKFLIFDDYDLDTLFHFISFISHSIDLIQMWN